MIVIFPPLFEEIQQLRSRLEQMEEEIRKLKEMPRVSSIEYHIQNLSVESIQNGILDLGVHMGDEMDKRIQTSGGTTVQDQQPSMAAGQDDSLGAAVPRIEQLERDMAEVKASVQECMNRLTAMEQRQNQWESRLCHLEAMHP